ncbi:Uma2 family endonuclease [Streptomyces sp. MK5]|uniref:Uma2 family endonuclease n=1 Tax=Streptomyces sp. MK5 TaxID=3064253 RepID=UPI0027416AF8|nr:Uma2 family endonuclease [Streptomyces sp. MK5]
MALMTERPTMGGIEPEGFEALLDALVAVDEAVAPTGFRAEIVRGTIVLSPWSKGYYHRVMRRVCEQLQPHLPEEHCMSLGPFLYVFSGDECAYGPDIHAAHEQVFETERHHLDGEALSFVAELTSTSTRKDDLIGKVEVCGTAGVPVYLVLDMQKQEATVYGAPSAAGYEYRVSKPFGEKLPVPEPFGCTLDTSGFRPPEDEA